MGAVPSPPSCPACGKETWSVAFEGLRDRLHGVPGESAVWRCESCGLLRQWPFPEDLARLYPTDYYSYIGPRPQRKDLARLIVRYLRRVHTRLAWWAHCRGFKLPRLLTRSAYRRSLAYRELTDYAPRSVSSALDIGCGAGDFLLDAQALGLRVRGVEMSDSAAAPARQRGLICDGAGIGGLDDIDEQFDLIRLSDVLEHLTDPVEALRAVSRRLSPQGVVLIRLPNVDGVMARICGPDWFPHELPRHLWGFGRESLALVLGQAGLGARRIVTRGHELIVYYSLRYLLESRAGLELPQSPSAEMLSLSARIMSVIDPAGLGDQMVVVAGGASASLPAA